MTETDYASLVEQISTLKAQAIKLENRINEVEAELKAEMKLAHQETSFVQREHGRRLSMQEKIVFGGVGAVLLTIIAAIMAMVIQDK